MNLKPANRYKFLVDVNLPKRFHKYFEKFCTIILGYLVSANFIIAREDKIFVFP